jgi:Flp pilus assembly protein TadG
MELGVPHSGAEMASGTKGLRAVIGTRTFKVLLLPGLAIFAVGAIEFAYDWNTKHILANAAREAARVAVSTPLNSATCTDRTPCSIESAADAAKRYLTKAGLGQASCINSRSPSFSGVLVWVFSCDGNTGCSTSNGSVCVKIDMTAVAAGQNGTLIPSTAVTVQYPRSWAVNSVLKRLPGGPTLPLPKSLSANALMRNGVSAGL